jgi:hypothetical protein
MLKALLSFFRSKHTETVTCQECHTVLSKQDAIDTPYGPMCCKSCYLEHWAGFQI